VIPFTGGENDMRLLHSLVPALVLLAGSHAIAQTAYPNRPIKMIIPLAAASAVDVAARIVTQKMADNMGQQFVILNMPGASGLIGPSRSRMRSRMATPLAASTTAS
jgi:tripartite-type tricarboxylate transporter receptor subunit TctC